MVFQAGELGLRTEPFEHELSPHEQINIIQSLTWVWWPLELCFFDRLTYSRRNDGKKTTHKPHLGSRRKIHPNQKIHGSLLLAGKLKSGYTPKARPLDDDASFWDTAREKGLGNWLELDLFDAVRAHVEKFITEDDSSVWENLRHIGTWGKLAQYLRISIAHIWAHLADGRQAVYVEVINGLKTLALKPEITFQLLHNTVDILRGHRANLQLSSSIEIPLVADLRHSHEKHYQETAQQFMEQFTDPSIFVLSGHTERITSVTFSPDGRRIVSGSWDRTIRIWDAGTGKPMGEPFQGHTAVILLVAFSPDGGRLVSGSYDQTIRIWDVETGKPMGEPFQGHTGDINSVAFSPDGGRIVSGSGDRTVRIWDAETGKSAGEPFQGHTGDINSVAFSPDGGRIVSGSDDRTIRIWDAETGKSAGEPFQGHNS
ncbi:uncharacterized protein LACBIDRAFT_391675 [Laccaria bicolor S238N-H82]|uniref:Predicted protein n=1 Tax=Laccaria bicolor (strain S238N-H82 / ATCC MYA-4686) TaxID=486041 RepID=B0DLX4_LACBS|nr:uncharacterized protein LACBIDRAFT_391675 [Laccaria bicolor S238N-H82]EDR04471.1 predicted protein [Laccaria bicolor S238N-H82]|eukprot:XP_001884990.1 predicted protein [Laccaria bicolor S238N-H82]